MLAEGEARSGVQSVLLGCALDLSRQSLTPSDHLSEIVFQPGSWLPPGASGLAPPLRDNRRQVFVPMTTTPNHCRNRQYCVAAVPSARPGLFGRETIAPSPARAPLRMARKTERRARSASYRSQREANEKTAQMAAQSPSDDSTATISPALPVNGTAAPRAERLGGDGLSRRFLSSAK